MGVRGEWKGVRRDGEGEGYGRGRGRGVGVREKMKVKENGRGERERLRGHTRDKEGTGIWASPHVGGKCDRASWS